MGESSVDPRSSHKTHKSKSTSSDFVDTTADSGKTLRIKHFISSDDNRSEIISCFRSLALLFNLPIKTDVFHRIIYQKYPESSAIISFEFCSALAESLGLQTQLLSLPSSLLFRLQVPALIRLNSTECSLVVDNNSNNLTIIFHRSGINTLTYSQFNALCSDPSSDSDTVPVLIFRKTDLTPEKKFGLSWFLPSLRKHKRHTEVFVASFFVQIFQLMNPLIVQQIIDKVIGQGGTGTLPVTCIYDFYICLI